MTDDIEQSLERQAEFDRNIKARLLAARRRHRTMRKALVVGVVILIAAGGWIIYERTRSDPESSAEAYFERALAHHEQENSEAAVIELKNLLQLKLDHADARWLLAQIYIELGDGNAAIKEIDNAEALGRGGPEVDLARLQATLLQGNYAQVLGQVALMDVDEEENLGFLMLRALARLGLGERDKAKAEFTKLLERDPENKTARKELARISLLEMDFETAEELLSPILAGEDLEAHLLKGEMEFSRLRYGNSRQLFEQALELDEENTVARMGVVRSLYAQGKFEEGKRLYNPCWMPSPRIHGPTT